MNSTDFLISGAGIIGLTLARELQKEFPNKKITICEKEKTVGLHASGKNSGVIHSGVYYPPETLKSIHCINGSKLMKEFCHNHQIPVLECGKFIIPSSGDEFETLKKLKKNGEGVGLTCHWVEPNQLNHDFPYSNPDFNSLFIQETAVVNPKEVLKAILKELNQEKINLYFEKECVQFNPKGKKATLSNGEEIQYDFFINASGLNALAIAKFFGIGTDYISLPFKGSYRKINFPQKTKPYCVYPVPDLDFPFLGIHLTPTVDGEFTIGPNAMPKVDFNFNSTGKLFNLLKMVSHRENRLTNHIWREIQNTRFSNVVKTTQKLMPGIEKEFIGKDYCKEGVRPQLMEKSSGKLVSDFILEKGNDSLHVLNSISPAFTSSFSVAKYLKDQILG